MPKVTILLQADRIEKKAYFIKKGLARAFAYRNDEEITFWFGKEGAFLASIAYITEDRKSYENIELLEDSELYCLQIPQLKKLFNEDINIAN